MLISFSCCPFPPYSKMEAPSELGLLPLKSYSTRYHDIGTLGSGSFGSVTLAKARPQLVGTMLKEMAQCPGTMLYPLSIYYRAATDLVAIKTMTKQLKRPQDYSKVKEIHFILSVNSHFNLVQIMDIFIDRTSLRLHIVMETMDQNLYQLMKSRKNIVFSPRTLKSILTQLLAAILHIHRHLFFHRDVKPENILVMQAQTFYGKSNVPPSQRDHPYIVKLADYGLARHVQNPKPYTAYVSTRWYRSPEILLRQSSYSFPVDLWAFGCVAVECATFIPLFPGSNELDQTDRVARFLGSPQPLSDGRSSFGGTWDDALPLAKKLQFRIDTKAGGSCLDNVIFRNDFSPKERSEFFEVVRSCLTWDPYKRITAVSLAHIGYFRNTIVDTKINKENVNEAAQAAEVTTSDAAFRKSHLLAGMVPPLNRKPRVADLKTPLVSENGPSIKDGQFSSVKRSVHDPSYLTLVNVNDIDDFSVERDRKFAANHANQEVTIEDESDSEDPDEPVEFAHAQSLVENHGALAVVSPKVLSEKKFEGQPVIKHRDLVDDLALDEELNSHFFP